MVMLGKPPKLRMIDERSGAISGVCRFGGIVEAKINCATIFGYAGHPLPGLGMVADALEAACIAFHSAAVGIVLRGCGFAQVAPRIVTLIKVGVINFIIGPLAGHDYPNKAMGDVKASIDRNADLPVLFNPTSDAASTSAPSEGAGDWVIGQKRSYIFSRQIVVCVGGYHGSLPQCRVDHRSKMAISHLRNERLCGVWGCVPVFIILAENLSACGEQHRPGWLAHRRDGGKRHTVPRYWWIESIEAIAPRTSGDLLAQQFINDSVFNALGGRGFGYRVISRLALQWRAWSGTVQAFHRLPSRPFYPVAMAAVNV
jgi:hypothetical protein